MRYEPNYEGVPAVTDCWVRLDDCGLSLLCDMGGSVGVESHTITADDVLDGDMSNMGYPPEEPPEGDVLSLYEEWNCEPTSVWECFDATIKASACPWLDDDKTFGYLAHQRYQNTMHDSNFHSLMDGASRTMREAVARDIAGLTEDNDKPTSRLALLGGAKTARYALWLLQRRAIGRAVAGALHKEHT